jgi:hypothetical protein
MNAPNEFEVREAWQKFLQMPEARDWYHTLRNAGLVQQEVLAGGMPYTAASLLSAYRKLRDALDKPTPSPIPPEPPIAVVEVREEDLPDYPVRGSLENGWKYEQRVTAWREQRKQREWRDKENQRLLNAPPAESTIRRTNTERKLVQQQNDLYRQRQQSVTKFE